MNSKAKKKKRQRERERLRQEEEKKEKETPIIIDNDLKSKEARKKESNFLLNKKFLSSEDGTVFEDHMSNHYKGFLHVPVNQLTPPNFHEKAKQAFEKLRDAQYYQYDVVMAGGKHSSRTFVKRTLVGEPGITYKYLGLRLFAHPWSGPDAPSIMKPIHDLNQNMIAMTKTKPNHGLCHYNLTLINYMEPTSHTKVGFKEDAEYGMGKVSVSWHADSSLEDNSSIGVYHCLPTQRTCRWDWKIALRPAPERPNATTIAPVTISTSDGDAYFLLGTFNETHQHAVLAGSESNRISSTHRVAVTKQDTYQYILRRVKGAKKHLRLQLESIELSQMDARTIVLCQKVLTEVELDWISQYWLQGEQHDKLHAWWQRPMKTLEAFWISLEELTFRLLKVCIAKPTVVPRAVLEGFLEELQVRHKQRQLWDERRADKIYQRRISPPFRPVARPVFNGTSESRLGKNLELVIQELTQTMNGGSKISTSALSNKAVANHNEMNRKRSLDGNLTGGRSNKKKWRKSKKHSNIS